MFKQTSMLRAMLALVLAAALPSAAMAVKFYVDNALGEVKPEEKVTPAQPKPVQILYEFQRDGAPNPKATKLTKIWVLDALKATGDFSEVVETPANNGAVLSIKFNNIVKKEELDKAKKDGFKAGLGFGLFGGVVATDYYEVTFEYVAETGATPIKTVVQHKLYSTFGKQKEGVVIPGTLHKKVDDAVKALVVQAINRGANNIVADAAFPK
jgi:hypothetical protein